MRQLEHLQACHSMMRGPTVQEYIFSILTRFRKYQYVITADIEKIFCQIIVSEEDRHLQRILWRSDPSDALRTYTLVTVTYGTTLASFIVMQCLVELGKESRKGLKKDVTCILDSAKLPLRKWCLNSPLVIVKVSKS